MRVIMLAAAAASALMGASAASASDKLVGTWATENADSRMRVAPCGKTLCVTLVWAKEDPKDIHNPDPSLRKRGIIGITLSKDMKPDGDGAWAGSIYNPENGKSYDITMRTVGAKQLEVEGCVLGVLCGSETWQREAEDTASATPVTAPRP